jgi:hypothetical protein
MALGAQIERRGDAGPVRILLGGSTSPATFVIPAERRRRRRRTDGDGGEGVARGTLRRALFGRYLLSSGRWPACPVPLLAWEGLPPARAGRGLTLRLSWKGMREPGHAEPERAALHPGRSARAGYLVLPRGTFPHPARRDGGIAGGQRPTDLLPWPVRRDAQNGGLRGVEVVRQMKPEGRGRSLRGYVTTCTSLDTPMQEKAIDNRFRSLLIEYQRQRHGWR